jgi:hypothetical protein
MRTAATIVLLVALSSATASAATPAPPAKTTTKAEVVPFIADDYARAVAEAKARGVPIFIEAWAPW